MGMVSQMVLPHPYMVEKIIVHESYDDKTNNYDITLLKLTQHVDYSSEFTFNLTIYYMIVYTTITIITCLCLLFQTTSSLCVCLPMTRSSLLEQDVGPLDLGQQKRGQVSDTWYDSSGTVWQMWDQVIVLQVTSKSQVVALKSQVKTQVKTGKSESSLKSRNKSSLKSSLKS